jgi:polyisoprenoid-binding protein YceI
MKFRTTRMAGPVAILVALTANGQVAQEGSHTALDVKAKGLKTFYVDDRAGANQVSVFSESTLEDFTIVCNKLGGQCSLDPQNVETFKGEFALRVEDLRTGIDLRDHHLRGPDWLDAAKYPKVIIKVIRVEDVKKADPNTASMTLISKCTFHGRTGDLRIPATVTYLDESPKTMERVKGDLLRLRGRFQIKLSDHGVYGPVGGANAVGLKVADVMPVRVTIFGSTERPPDPLKPDTAGPATQPTGPSASSQPSGESTSRPSILSPPTR